MDPRQAFVLCWSREVTMRRAMLCLLLGLLGCSADTPSSPDTGDLGRDGRVRDGVVADGTNQTPDRVADVPRFDATAPKPDGVKPKPDGIKPKPDLAKPDLAKPDAVKPKPDLGKTDSGAPLSIAGYWVWKQQVENGAVTLTITDADMVKQVGPTGWPGCPSGIICTHYGIRKLAFGATGKSHYIMNVTTSSDYQFPGTYSVSGDLVTYQRLEKFSCAHPSEVDTIQSTRYFRYKMVGPDELWVSVTGFSVFDVPWPTTAPTAPTRWVVYKRITQQDFYAKYMIRICQAPPPCHPGCFSTTLVN